MLSVDQLLEKGYKVLFKNKQCLIKDVDGKEMFKVNTKGKKLCSKSNGGGARGFSIQRDCLFNLAQKTWASSLSWTISNTNIELGEGLTKPTSEF